MVAFTDERHAEVEATWCIYQEVVAVYRHPNPAEGKRITVRLITNISSGAPKALREVITLRRTLKRRAADILAYFDNPGTSNGPTETTNGRLEHLRGSAPGFRNQANHIAHSLLESGGLRPQLHRQFG